MKKKPHKAGQSSSGSGNVTIDLGEKIEAKLRQAGMAGTGMGAKASSKPGGYRPGGYRPGMFGSYRPWYASRWSALGGGSQLGKMMLGLPETVNTGKMLTGSLLGIAANRALVRLSPYVIQNPSRLLHEAIAFVVGMVPYVVKRDSPVALGVAVPGFVFLGGALVDSLFDYVGFKPPRALEGPRPQQGHAGGGGGQMAARQRLANLQTRMAQHAQGAPRAAAPRVVAQPR